MCSLGFGVGGWGWRLEVGGRGLGFGGKHAPRKRTWAILELLGCCVGGAVVCGGWGA